MEWNFYLCFCGPDFFFQIAKIGHKDEKVEKLWIKVYLFIFLSFKQDMAKIKRPSWI